MCLLCPFQGNVTEDNYDDLLVILVVLVDGAGSTDQTGDNFMTTIAFLVATAAIVQDPLVIVDMPDEVSCSTTSVRIGCMATPGAWGIHWMSDTTKLLSPKGGNDHCSSLYYDLLLGAEQHLDDSGYY